MLLKAAVLWVAGLLTIVPYATYYLFVHAQRDQYALLITLVLFWIFGYWGIAGPILALVKVRKVFSAIQAAQSKGQLMEMLRGKDAHDVAIDFIAAEYRIPRFLASRVLRLAASRLAGEAGDGPPRARG